MIIRWLFIQAKRKIYRFIIKANKYTNKQSHLIKLLLFLAFAIAYMVITLLINKQFKIK